MLWYFLTNNTWWHVYTIHVILLQIFDNKELRKEYNRRSLPIGYTCILAYKYNNTFTLPVLVELFCFMLIVHKYYYIYGWLIQWLFAGEWHCLPFPILKRLLYYQLHLADENKYNCFAVTCIIRWPVYLPYLSSVFIFSLIEPIPKDIGNCIFLELIYKIYLYHKILLHQLLIEVIFSVTKKH